LLRHAFAALAAGVMLAGCSSGGAATRPSPPKPVSTTTLDGLLLSPGDISAVMGITAITPDHAFSLLPDHSNLLPNINCLGIWKIGEKVIYGPSGFLGVRGQMLREPDSAAWDSLVVQGVALYASTDAAQNFYAQSSDRWSKCSNHVVNLTVNNLPRTTWTFGNLTRTDTELTMPLAWSGNGGRSCQRVLAVDNNAIIDVEACGQVITDQASSIVDKIRSRVDAAG
jgi:PknH-like extracellular domain